MIAVVVVLSLLDVCIQQVNFIKQKGAFTLPTTESSGLKLITMIYDDWFKKWSHVPVHRAHNFL